MTETMFTTDWSFSISYWPDMFHRLGLTGKPDLRFLEIGCFEGRTTRWLLENVLTHGSSRIHVVDTFEGNAEFEPLGISTDFRERFDRNISEYADRVRVWTGRSQDVLRDVHFYWNAPDFDFVYVDGSHMAADVLTDAVLAWDYLKPGGVLCFDDYRWGTGGPRWARPGPAIDAFVACYAPHLKGAPQGHDQFVVIKNAE